MPGGPLSCDPAGGRTREFGSCARTALQTKSLTPAQLTVGRAEGRVDAMEGSFVILERNAEKVFELIKFPKGELRHCAEYFLCHLKDLISRLVLDRQKGRSNR
eukprot:3356419-Rhodomonas_salina.2